jgi:endonuclease-8
MPEGDTLARAAATLHAALAGHVVTAFTARIAPVASAAEDHAIAGRVIERVVARGKHLIVMFSGGVLLRSHLRMHGSWHLYRPGEPWRRSPARMRLRVDTAAWCAVAFDVYDAELVAAETLDRVRALAALGPDLAQPGVDLGLAATRLQAAGDRAIGEVLLDQRIVAGLGNVYRSEVLFLARISPFVPAGRLDRPETEALVRIAADLLRVNVARARGGRVTTRRQSPGDALWVYRRRGLPCRRCGTAVQSAATPESGRRVYWCPHCQRPPGGSSQA